MTDKCFYSSLIIRHPSLGLSLIHKTTNHELRTTNQSRLRRDFRAPTLDSHFLKDLR